MPLNARFPKTNVGIDRNAVQILNFHADNFNLIQKTLVFVRQKSRQARHWREDMGDGPEGRIWDIFATRGYSLALDGEITGGQTQNTKMERSLAIEVGVKATDKFVSRREVDTPVHPFSSGSATPNSNGAGQECPAPLDGRPFQHLHGMKKLSLFFYKWAVFFSLH